MQDSHNKRKRDASTKKKRIQEGIPSCACKEEEEEALTENKNRSVHGDEEVQNGEQDSSAAAAG